MTVENWPELLADYVQDAKKIGFVWGENDCALYASGWVRLVTEFDPAEEFRGKYSSEIGSKRALIKYGTGELISTFESRMISGGFPEIDLNIARRGDIIAADFGGAATLGVISDHRASFLTNSADYPISLFPISVGSKVWRII